MTQEQNDYRYAHRSSINMTQAMWDRLGMVVAARRDPKFKTSDAIREAIRLYLDSQEDLIGSRKHFSKSLHRQLNSHEQSILFILNAILLLNARLFVYLLKHQEGREIARLVLIQSALVDSKKHSAQIMEATAKIKTDAGLEAD